MKLNGFSILLTGLTVAAISMSELSKCEGETTIVPIFLILGIGIAVVGVNSIIFGIKHNRNSKKTETTSELQIRKDLQKISNLRSSWIMSRDICSFEDYAIKHWNDEQK